MQIRDRTLAIRRIYRCVYLPCVDTIPEIRSRNTRFAAVRDAIQLAGTDSLSHFLEERGPHRTYVEIGSAGGRQYVGDSHAPSAVPYLETELSSPMAAWDRHC